MAFFNHDENKKDKNNSLGSLCCTVSLRFDGKQYGDCFIYCHCYSQDNTVVAASPAEKIKKLTHNMRVFGSLDGVWKVHINPVCR